MYYLIALVVPPLLLFANSRFRSRPLSLTALALASTVLMYLVIVGSAFAFIILHEHQLDAYDLNGDGVFSEGEQSQAQAEAMDRVINDVGRNFTIALGAAWSVFVSTLFFVGVFGVRIMRKQRQGATS